MYEDNLFAVDTTGVSAMGGYELFPAGLYPAMMVSASKKPTKDGNGAFIECVYQVTEGEMAGKKFTSRVNLWNQNAQTVDIAKRELKSLKVALGLPDTEGRTELFMHKPVILNIGVKPRKDKPQELENNLIAIEPYGGAPVQQAPAGYAQAPMAYQPQQPQHMQPPFGQPPMQQQQQQPRPAAPAFTPNAAQPAPWLVGAR